MAAQGQTPKTMSSRLMGMKFMQRSAASSPTNAKSSDPPSAKRSKLNNGSPQARRAADQEAFAEVQAQEDAKREAILDKLAEEAGDTKWVLQASTKTIPRLHVVNAGYGAIDASAPVIQDEGDDEEDDSSRSEKVDEDGSREATYNGGGGGIAGRKSFGKFNRQIEKQHNPDLSSSSDGEDEGANGRDDDDDDDDDDGQDNSSTADDGKAKNRKSSSVADDLRARRKAKRREERRAALNGTERRKSKEVKLNPHMTSISSGGQKSSRSNETCFSCGKPGHRAADCPRGNQHKKHKRKST